MLCCEFIDEKLNLNLSFTNVLLICVCVAYERQVDKPVTSPQEVLSLPQKCADLPCRASQSQQGYYQSQLGSICHVFRT